MSHCVLSSVFFYFGVSPHFSPPNGFERSQHSPWRFNHCGSNVMVLKEVNSVRIHNGLEMSQFTMFVPNGLERIIQYNTIANLYSALGGMPSSYQLCFTMTFTTFYLLG